MPEPSPCVPAAQPDQPRKLLELERLTIVDALRSSADAFDSGAYAAYKSASVHELRDNPYTAAAAKLTSDLGDELKRLGSGARQLAGQIESADGITIWHKPKAPATGGVA